MSAGFAGLADHLFVVPEGATLGIVMAVAKLYLARMLQRTLPAGFIAPCLPTKTDKLPSGSQWLHEIIQGYCGAAAVAVLAGDAAGLDTCELRRARLRCPCARTLSLSSLRKRIEAMLMPESADHRAEFGQGRAPGT